MDPERVVKAAQALVHLWQGEAKTALISLGVWPELGEAIDELADSFAPAPVHPGAAVLIRELLPDDEIRYPAGPFESGDDTWTVREVVPDESRPGLSYWRLTAGRFVGANWTIRAGEHSPAETVILVRRPS